MTAESLGLSQLDHALNAVLMLSHVATRAGDQVGLCAFDTRVRAYLPPQGGRRAAQRVIAASYDIHAQIVETDFEAAYGFLSQRLRKRSLVVLFTQVIDDVSAKQVVRTVRGLGPRHLPLAVLFRDETLDRMAEPRAAARQARRALPARRRRRGHPVARPPGARPARGRRPGPARLAPQADPLASSTATCASRRSGCCSRHWYGGRLRDLRHAGAILAARDPGTSRRASSPCAGQRRRRSAIAPALHARSLCPPAGRLHGQRLHRGEQRRHRQRAAPAASPGARPLDLHPRGFALHVHLAAAPGATARAGHGFATGTIWPEASRCAPICKAVLSAIPSPKYYLVPTRQPDTYANTFGLGAGLLALPALAVVKPFTSIARPEFDPALAGRQVGGRGGRGWQRGLSLSRRGVASFAVERVRPGPALRPLHLRLEREQPDLAPARPGRPLLGHGDLLPAQEDTACDGALRSGLFRFCGMSTDLHPGCRRGGGVAGGASPSRLAGVAAFLPRRLARGPGARALWLAYLRRSLCRRPTARGTQGGAHQDGKPRPVANPLPRRGRGSAAESRARLAGLFTRGRGRLVGHGARLLRIGSGWICGQ